ncbi:TIR domain-containing protein [Glutamicibacter sp. NPDC087661]|uniref:TIR domain-containing protein n=1 Tax=Glutamicibacter sp. NPDC087661 TaxID=3363996 RepID=UPI0038181921
MDQIEKLALKQRNGVDGTMRPWVNLLAYAKAVVRKTHRQFAGSYLVTGLWISDRYDQCMPPKLRMSEAALAEKIGEAIATQKVLQNMSRDSESERSALRQAITTWDERNTLLLEHAFTPVGFAKSSPHTDYVSAMGLKNPFPSLSDGDKPIEDLLTDSRTKVDRLRRLLANLDLYEKDDQDSGAKATKEATSLNTVFIVHGHDHDAINQVHLLIRQTSDLNVIVLGDQASRGQTVIEKLERHLGDRSSFAVVLMTGDDLGRSRSNTDEKPRARQNVIFELGYALAALGRGNVTALYEPGVEMPSDFAGVVYIPFDENGMWKQSLIREFRGAGLNVDANRL